MNDPLHPVMCRWGEDGIEYVGHYETDHEGGFCMTEDLDWMPTIMHRLTDPNGSPLPGIERLEFDTVDLTNNYAMSDEEEARYLQGVENVSRTRMILQLHEMGVTDDEEAGAMLYEHFTDPDRVDWASEED